MLTRPYGAVCADTPSASPQAATLVELLRGHVGKRIALKDGTAGHTAWPTLVQVQVDHITVQYVIEREPGKPKDAFRRTVVYPISRIFSITQHPDSKDIEPLLELR